MIYYFQMKVFNLFSKTSKKKRRNISDYYQDSINRIGKEQIRKLVEKGLGIPVALL